MAATAARTMWWQDPAARVAADEALVARVAESSGATREELAQLAEDFVAICRPERLGRHCVCYAGTGCFLHDSVGEPQSFFGCRPLGSNAFYALEHFGQPAPLWFLERHARTEAERTKWRHLVAQR